MSEPHGVVLLADIGGTNARFRLQDREGTILHEVVLSTPAFPGPAEAIEAAVAGTGLHPTGAVLALAGPVEGDDFAFTNADWHFSRIALERQLGLTRLVLLNDFEALASALPLLGEADREVWQAGRPQAGRALGILGPGTGLGMAAAVPAGDRWTVVSGEGGHGTAAAQDEFEWAILSRLRARAGHVSWERVACGPALSLLADLVAAEWGQPEPRLASEEVAVSDLPTAVEARRLFAAFLGGAAGNFALCCGTRAGIYFAGGVLPKLGTRFDRDLFLRRFREKGRFESYLRDIPLWLLTRRDAAFVGMLAHLLPVPRP